MTGNSWPMLERPDSCPGILPALPSAIGWKVIRCCRRISAGMPPAVAQVRPTEMPESGARFSLQPVVFVEFCPPFYGSSQAAMTLWRTEGYVRRCLAILSPRVFAQERFHTYIDIQSGRSIVLAEPKHSAGTPTDD